MLFRKAPKSTKEPFQINTKRITNVLITLHFIQVKVEQQTSFVSISKHCRAKWRETTTHNEHFKANNLVCFKMLNVCLSPFGSNQIWSKPDWGSDCGSVGREVTSDTSGPQF